MTKTGIYKTAEWLAEVHRTCGRTFIFRSLPPHLQRRGEFQRAVKEGYLRKVGAKRIRSSYVAVWKIVDFPKTYRYVFQEANMK